MEGFCGLKGEDSYAEESDTKKDTSEESFSSTPDSCCKSPEELLEKKQGRSSAGNRSRVNSGHSVEHLRELGLPVDDMRWQELLSNPRCVLCSKVFDCGEDIAHSNNPKCSHEYHIECLTKYWAKNKTDNCPVCKQKFIVEEHTA